MRHERRRLRGDPTNLACRPHWVSRVTGLGGCCLQCCCSSANQKRSGAAEGWQGAYAGPTELAALTPPPLLPDCLAAVVRDWRILWLAACWLLIAAVMYGLTFFMPLLVGAMFSGGGGAVGSTHHRSACAGGNPAAAGSQPTKADQQRNALVAFATAAPFLMAACGMNLNARLAERANERHRHAGWPIVLGGAALLLTPLALRAVGPGLAFAMLTLAAGFCWSFHGVCS